MPIEISTFFSSYIRSFDKLDPNRIAEHYHVPSTVSDATGMNNFNSKAQAFSKMESYCNGFEANGYTGARYECDYYQSLGEEACFVDLKWMIDLADSVLEYKTAYTLHKIEGLWKIGSAVVYGYQSGA